MVNVHPTTAMASLGQDEHRSRRFDLRARPDISLGLLDVRGRCVDGSGMRHVMVMIVTSMLRAH